ncbi:cyclin domain protein [Opisthorchis viverrini]|uniref:Cyclin domain protein n=2 Tax=Opisthorchis viverrini TaxID=6198 RepID=A0A1S8XAC7_OPIVI|nr:cyclin domain protein [Opisthorchis viverrini]
MLTRGTRTRFGAFGNENNMISAKENVGLQKNGIVTRSRSALGDIKNKGFGVHNKEAGTNANAKKGPVGVSSKSSRFLTVEEPQKSCDMSIDEGAPKGIIPPQSPVQSELKTFRSGRHAIRSRFLVQESGKKYLDYENEDFGDSATVYPYAEAIFNYLQNRELAVQPMHRDFISADGEVNPRMRYILINWLVQIHHSYKLQPETLYLCIAILDRYLMKHSKELTKDCFQLIGIASLFIAAKFEEMYPPDISDFTAVTHNAFNKSDIRNCEQTILQSIDFYLSIPIPLVYLRRLSRAVDADRTMHNLAKYLLELTIQEYDLAHLNGNMRAVVALCLSRALCFQTSNLEDAWCDAMSYLSGYTVDEVREPLKILARAAYRQNSPSKYRAIFEKYRLDDFYGRVATLPQLRSCLMETLADLKFDSDGELNTA